MLLGLYQGNVKVLLGLAWDNGKENGNYYNGLYRDYRVYVGVILGSMLFLAPQAAFENLYPAYTPISTENPDRTSGFQALLLHQILAWQPSSPQDPIVPLK